MPHEYRAKPQPRGPRGATNQRENTLVYPLTVFGHYGDTERVLAEAPRRRTDDLRVLGLLMFYLLARSLGSRSMSSLGSQEGC